MIKRLPMTRRRNRNEYRLLKRTQFVAMYEQFCPTFKPGLRQSVAGMALQGYEVFRVLLGKAHPRSTPNEARRQQLERFPHDEAFGVTAWAYSTLEAANKRYNQLVEKYPDTEEWQDERA